MQRSSKIQAIRETSGERRERTPTSELEKNSKTGTAAAFHLSRRLRSTTEDIKKDPSQICKKGPKSNTRGKKYTERD